MPPNPKRRSGDRIQRFLVALEMHRAMNVVRGLAFAQRQRGGGRFQLVEFSKLRLAGGGRWDTGRAFGGFVKALVVGRDEGVIGQPLAGEIVST